MVEFVMGMPIVVDVRDDGSEHAVDAVFGWLRFVDATFSTYRHDSEISRLNRGELALADADPSVREVLTRCDELHDETRRFFDVRFRGDGSVDPSGFVKGWSIDRAGAILDHAGARNYAINAGGDLILRGDDLPEAGWRVGIQHPQVPQAVAAVIEASDLAVATTGEYRRGRHVLDPRTGRPPSDVLSVTVAGPELGTADAYATAAFAMGAAGPHWTARLRGYEAMTVLADERVLSTPGFPAE
jgi:thiamine biosynthesis lipoprotein